MAAASTSASWSRASLSSCRFSAGANSSKRFMVKAGAELSIRPSTRIQRCFHAAMKPGQGFRKQRWAVCCLQLQTRQLVLHTSGAQAETPYPVQVIFAEQVQGKGAAGLNQFPGEMLLGQTHHHPRQGGNDGRLADEGGNQPAPAPCGAGRDQPDRRVQLGKHIGAGFAHFNIALTARVFSTPVFVKKQAWFNLWVTEEGGAFCKRRFQTTVLQRLCKSLFLT